MARAANITVRIDRPRPANDPVTALELGQRLCAVFGISADRTHSITINLEAGTIAAITVEQIITRGQADDLLEVASTYGLHRAEPVRQLSPGFTIRDWP